MGKSHISKTVLKAEYGVMYHQIDNFYTHAVIASGMAGDGPATAPDVVAARRRARDRRWPDDTTKDAFFAAYRQQVADAVREATDRGVVVVFEGGTLRHVAEAEVVVAEARNILGEGVRVVRATVIVSYSRWLVNRIQRMANAGREQIPVSVLTQDAYKRVIKAARVRDLTPCVEDFRVTSPAAVRQLMADLGYAPLSQPPDLAQPATDQPTTGS